MQAIRFAVATDSGQRVSYGGTFDTLASIGQTAIIAQTTMSDSEAFRAQQFYAQRIWANRRAAVGLMQDYQSAVFTNYRMVGGEFGSFYGTLLDPTKIGRAHV